MAQNSGPRASSAHQVQVRIGQQRKNLREQRDALPSVLARKPAASVQSPQLIRSVPADLACMRVGGMLLCPVEAQAVATYHDDATGQGPEVVMAHQSALLSSYK